MGDYVMAIGTKPLKVLGGRIHGMRFAYKPYGGFGGWRQNDKMHARVCGPTERAWEKLPTEARENVLVISTDKPHDGAVVYKLAATRGTIYDSALGEKGREKVGVLIKEGRSWRYMPDDIDALWAAHTGFKSAADALASPGHYRPSMDMREPVMRKLADDYDTKAEAAGDPRRAYRYGNGH